ncbi:hypothetical protein [Bacillus sp. UNC438CL73TsuS30]|uniref:hypothetical protein n=1 Tax=Bacillus sp. UNC438CL73TsuS30 TaxID=1340434 RepID=UPI00047EE98B|nr:hypothetical protein [Bacillus sp. UNC438CL73TsuS30]
MGNFNENIQSVREIRGNVPKYMLQVREEFREKKARLQENQLLTYQGKQVEEQKLKEQYEKIFLGNMLKADEMINTLLDESENEAQKVLTAALPPVDETQQKLFDKTLKGAEGKITFALNDNQAMGALEELVQAASEPALAEQAKEKFLPLAQAVLAQVVGNDKAAIKYRLNSMYQELDGRAQVEGADEARGQLETINGLKGAWYVTGYVQDMLKEISMNAYEYVNNPKAYFDKKAQA